VEYWLSGIDVAAGFDEVLIGDDLRMWQLMLNLIGGDGFETNGYCDYLFRFQ
ncbi:hypothetical protein A2U01_0056748, partial [Trifolium medium]|nr:hypothetical protein [Trifolium medium]